jgi:acetyl-CoA C-acetyltransferase
MMLDAVTLSTQKAFAQARVAHADIDLFEVHDAFSIMAALSLEAAGFARPGQAVQMARDGEIAIGGRLPIATMGGLKSRGHPVGATGVYQIVEVVAQLTDMAGVNQVKDANIGMAQNIGGSGATVITHILGAV